MNVHERLQFWITTAHAWSTLALVILDLDETEHLLQQAAALDIHAIDCDMDEDCLCEVGSW